MTDDVRRVHVVCDPHAAAHEREAQRRQWEAEQRRVAYALAAVERLPHVRAERRREAVARLDAEVAQALARLP